ncbi:hypothetical protein V6N13_023967 [Hibiscus sabdariffa]
MALLIFPILLTALMSKEACLVPADKCDAREYVCLWRLARDYGTTVPLEGGLTGQFQPVDVLEALESGAGELGYHHIPNFDFASKINLWKHGSCS